MKKVHGSDDRLLIGFLKGVLDDHGIPCLTKNEYLAGGVGELPPAECWPELWVIEDADAFWARRLVAEALTAEHAAGGDWRCEVCGERIEAQFTDCWRCAKTTESA